MSLFLYVFYVGGDVSSVALLGVDLFWLTLISLCYLLPVSLMLSILFFRIMFREQLNKWRFLLLEASLVIQVLIGHFVCLEIAYN